MYPKRKVDPPREINFFKISKFWATLMNEVPSKPTYVMTVDPQSSQWGKKYMFWSQIYHVNDT